MHRRSLRLGLLTILFSALLLRDGVFLGGLYYALIGAFLGLGVGFATYRDKQGAPWFEKFYLLRDYIAFKKKELAEYNASRVGDTRLVANARRLTNIGTFRAYITRYLRDHPKVHQDMTLMVRQLNPTPDGLPLEIYVFSNDVAWVNYEGIQADIFDHIIAIVPEFGLRVFQAPSGHDLAALAGQGDGGQYVV